MDERNEWNHEIVTCNLCIKIFESRKRQDWWPLCEVSRTQASELSIEYDRLLMLSKVCMCYDQSGKKNHIDSEFIPWVAGKIFQTRSNNHTTSKNQGFFISHCRLKILCSFFSRTKLLNWEEELSEDNEKSWHIKNRRDAPGKLIEGSLKVENEEDGRWV